MIVVAGEALIDLVADDTATYRAVVGGSPGNVAVGLARLGQHVRLLARLSNDPFGQHIRAHLAGNGVDLTWAVSATEPTSLAVASLDAAGRAGYAFYLNGTADWQWSAADLPVIDGDISAVHSGSLALSQLPGAAAIEAMLAAAPVTVSIDLNLRPSICGDRRGEQARVERQIRHAQVVKASDEDLAWLYPDRTVEDTTASWIDAGAACAVVTLGGDGAHLRVAGSSVFRRTGRSVTVVDTVGAGDAFTAGLLDALARIDALGSDPYARLSRVTDDQWVAALDHANAVAAITCGRRGANPPTAAEVDG